MLLQPFLLLFVSVAPQSCKTLYLLVYSSAVHDKSGWLVMCCVDAVMGGSGAVRLPWGAVRERQAFPESVHISVNNKPGAFVLQMIFAEFTVLAEKKIEMVLDSQVPRSLSLSLCLYVRMYVCVSVYTRVSLYVYMHLCLYTCHSVCGCVCRAVIVAFFFHRTLFVTFCLITNTSDSDDCCVLVVLFIV